MSQKKRRVLPNTPFEKGKPVERLGRKATGLPAVLPLLQKLAGLPKERSNCPSRASEQRFSEGGPPIGLPLHSLKA